MSQATKTKTPLWTWDVNVDAMVGRNCFVETLDGVRREGKISGTEVRELKIKDVLKGVQTVVIPMHIQLNGDPTDIIEFTRMQRFELR